MTLFDNLKNKLFKEETSGKGKESQPAGKSKDLQDRIKGLFAKKPDEVEQAVEELDMSRESQETSRYQRSKQKKPIDTTKPLGKVRAFLSKFTLSPRNPIRRFWRRYHIGKILFILVAVLVLTVGSYLFYIAKTTNVSDLQDALKATTVIYDKEGNQAGSLSGQKGTYVELDAISDSLENAVIATEDRTFYKNSGINVKRFLLAIVSMGRFGGGSTITQQLAKNAFLTQEQTVTRKAKEFFLSLELTKKYSKQEILTMYLNNAYFGNGVWGVEDASQKYFGTSAANLTVDEAATLAGMLKGPEIYNPIDNIQNATNRRNTVLANMVDDEKLSQADADSAAGVDMASRLVDTYQGTGDDYRYPSYFDAVIEEATKTYGLSEDEIVKNGYKIYTEMDANSQANMQQTYENSYLFPTSESDGSTAQSASVALDPSTGAVRGLVIQPSVISTMQPKGSVVLVRQSNLWWFMLQLWLQGGASIRTYLIRQLITMAIPQPTMVVLRLMMCPCIKLWPTLTIFRQFISLTKSVYKKGLVTVRNLVLTLIMFQKN